MEGPLTVVDEPSQSKQRRTRRRGRGEDSIYQRASDKRWIVEIRDGYKPNGKPNIKYLTAKTKREAQEKHRNALRDRAKGLPVSNDSESVASYITSWLEHKVKHSRRPNTYDGYESVCRVHIIPSIGRIKLSKLTQRDVQSMLSRAIEHGVSPTTAKNIRAVLRKALNDAMREDLIGRNVVTLTDMPAQRTYHPKPLSAAELDRFIEAARGTRPEALFILLPAIGLREGEAFGLRWQDIDLDRAILSVQHQLQRIGKPKRPRFVDTKTERSRSPVPLPAQVVKALQAHRERQLVEREVAGPNWQGSEWQHLVFCTTIGTPLDPSNVIKQYRAILDKAGIDKTIEPSKGDEGSETPGEEGKRTYRRIHDLRHTCGTMLAQLGVHPRQAQEILRHSQITTTLAIYTSVLGEDVKQAMNKMDALLGGETAETEQT